MFDVVWAEAKSFSMYSAHSCESVLVLFSERSRECGCESQEVLPCAVLTGACFAFCELWGTEGAQDFPCGPFSACTVAPECPGAPPAAKVEPANQRKGRVEHKTLRLEKQRRLPKCSKAAVFFPWVLRV